MTKHKTGTGEEWLAARIDLLKAEKELTRRIDELAQKRQELQWLRIDKKYRFETDDGNAFLADVFGALGAAELFLSNAIRVMARTAGRAGGGKRCVLYV